MMAGIPIDVAEPYREIVAQAAEVGRRLEPIAVDADNSSTVDPEVRRLLVESGLMDLTVPASYGGRFQSVDPFAICVVREQLMAVSSHADSLFALQGLGSFAITVGGSPEQCGRWLPGIATGQVLASLALTEPVAGSDLKSLTTTAKPHAGRIVLNGHKSFISNAGAADFYTVLAREDDGFSVFLVPADTPGLSTLAGPELASPHVLGDVVFDDVTLGDDARLGRPGDGLNIVLSTLSVFRVSVAGAAVGLAQAALDEAVRHATAREQFGRSLIRLGPVAGLIADSWADVASSRLLTYDAARRASSGPLENLEYSSLAKVCATEACARVVDRCGQVMGRWGLIRDSRLERCARQARPMRIYEGASEVLRLGIARYLSASLD